MYFGVQAIPSALPTPCRHTSTLLLLRLETQMALEGFGRISPAFPLRPAQGFRSRLTQLSHLPWASLFSLAL